MTLTRGIAMPRGTDNAMCHTQGLDTWHFYLFFSKIKNKKKTRTDTWHVIEALFKSWDAIDTFLNRVPIGHIGPYWVLYE